ncbi:MAG: hypothetical protein AVDCRST_MAG79-2934, partial [uncultured Thermoleophilia bacterium]
ARGRGSGDGARAVRGVRGPRRGSRHRGGPPRPGVLSAAHGRARRPAGALPRTRRVPPLPRGRRPGVGGVRGRPGRLPRRGGRRHLLRPRDGASPRVRGATAGARHLGVPASRGARRVLPRRPHRRRGDGARKPPGRRRRL